MIHLHWAIHNHQPVGNFDFIFERAYQQAYKPYLDVLASHPTIRMSMHFSGILLNWLEKNRPEYLKKLRNVVEKGQLEILGGGYYEPILPVISDSDKIGQLRKLQDAIKRTLGVTPKGIWLAERVWEPTLVKPIAEAGIEFVILDGSHFKMVGKTEVDMDGYFLSEDQGHVLKLFPIHDTIRDYIPFRSVDEVIHALLNLESNEQRKGKGDLQVVFGDDGEKFGDWPGTHETVFKQNWLHQFFERVEGLDDRLKIEPLEMGLKPEKNLGLVYLPPASYQEMMVWAQDGHDISKFRRIQNRLQNEEGTDSARFIRGTFWRNFFIKYPESNQMHKQGIRLANTLAEQKSTLTKKVLNLAQDHLWQAQCNCGYWHGVFGGLYLPHLRFALYRNLIQAQCQLDSGLFTKGTEPIWEILDWNFDGKPEYSLNSPEVYLSLNQNGALIQFWLKKTGINLVDTMTRRFEAYHEQIDGSLSGGTKLENSLGAKEENLRGYLTYDRKTRHSLSDLYLPAGTDFTEYSSQKNEFPFCFVTNEVKLLRHDENTEIRFIGIAHTINSDKTMQVEKSIFLEKKSANLRVEWRFTNIAEQSVDFRFGSESLFCLLAGNAPDRYISWNGPESARDKLASKGSMPGTDSVQICDDWLQLKTETRIQKASGTWRDCIETVSQSEGGYERVYQGTVLIPYWDFKIEPGKKTVASMSIQFQEGA